MMQAVGGPSGQGGSMQPGAGGSTMQPGMGGNTMSPPTTVKQ